MKSTKWHMLSSIMLAFVLSACGGDSDETAVVPVLPSTSATGFVSSDAPDVITVATESGAKVAIPPAAVPETASGEVGTIAFSIEKDTTTALQIPAGVTQESDAYLFGPSGTVFAKPVAVTIPLSGTFSPDREYKLYRVNQTTGVSEPFPTTYNPENNSLTAHTYKFSPWWIGSRNADNTNAGCLKVDNRTSDIWRSLVVQGSTPKYLPGPPDPIGNTSIWSPPGTIGWSDYADDYLSQGTWEMCVEGELLGEERHSGPIVVNIDNPWSYYNKICEYLNIGSLALPFPGRCSTSPAPTPSVGTGDLQISLVWHSSEAVDLDLHVVEPSGEVIYYAQPTSSSGGTLDRDNQWGDYVNGRSENIYWTNPASGTYQIKVDFYSDCDGSVTSMPFEVRVVNKGVTTTYTGTAVAGVALSTFKTIVVE